MAKYSVNPEVLIWAREESKLTLEESAEKLKGHLGSDPIARLASLESESNREQLTFSLLQAISNAYGVSLVTLFLPSAPPHSEQPTDFRTLKGRAPILGKETISAIRNTQRFMEAINELIQDVPGSYQQPDLPQVNLSDNPEAIANVERGRLKVTVQTQHSWPNPSKAFDAWRWHVEQLGILVFTFHMPIKDCLGFALNNDGLPAIVVNSNYDDAGQIFTLFHEYAHVLLRQFGICGRTEKVDDKKIEVFSNNFAASLLMPKHEVTDIAELCSLNNQTKLEFDNVLEAGRSISNYFKVSVESAILRIERLGLAPLGSHYEYGLRMQGRGKTQQGGHVVPYYRRYLNRFGNRYLSIILSALHENHINAVEAYDMLGGVKSRHFRDLETDLTKRHKEYSSI